MAVRKPLVQVAGQIQQLQAGDSIEHPVLFNRTNQSGGAAVIGQPVRTSTAGAFDLAQANSLANSKVLGLVADISIADTTPGAVQTHGKLMATTGQWDAVTGETGGLTTGAKYFLSPTTAGMLTQTAPSVDGQVIAAIGEAMSTTEMDIDIDQTILL